MLLAARDSETGEVLTNPQIYDELITIMIAGTAATATTMSWAIYELDRHPAVELSLLQEIDTVIGDRACNFSDVANLKYTELVFKETLRLHSPLLVIRRSIGPFDLGGIAIPAGTEIAYSPYALHRDPGLYPDPARFDPDRWLPDRADHLPRQAFTPFGAGKRICIGEGYAWIQMIITLVTLLRQWRFSLTSGHTVREKPAGMVRPNALPMTISTR